LSIQIGVSLPEIKVNDTTMGINLSPCKNNNTSQTTTISPYNNPYSELGIIQESFISKVETPEKTIKFYHHYKSIIVSQYIKHNDLLPANPLVLLRRIRKIQI
jgi:hypothetical protein